jgi:hypothetical protein
LGFTLGPLFIAKGHKGQPRVLPRGDFPCSGSEKTLNFYPCYNKGYKGEKKGERKRGIRGKDTPARAKKGLKRVTRVFSNMYYLWLFN